MKHSKSVCAPMPSWSEGEAYRDKLAVPQIEEPTPTNVLLRIVRDSHCRGRVLNILVKVVFIELQRKGEDFRHPSC